MIWARMLAYITGTVDQELLLRTRSTRVSNGTRCHKNVILMVVNGGKMRTKGEQRRRKGFIGFSRNLLISFDYGQLRQVLMKLVVRLLTEGLSQLPFPSQAFTATSKTLADSSFRPFRPMTMISAGSSKPKSCSSPKGRRNNATAASLAFGRSFGERQGFEKISWEETEKQKARMCRAQELARSRAQENERQKRAAMEISDSRDEERTAVS